MAYLVDTDILIDLSRRSAGALEYLESIGDWSYSIMTEMELVAGARNSDEVTGIVHTLDPYTKVPLSEDVGELASNLLKSYSKSHGLDPTDALIAATAIHESLTLSTRNRKHFEAIGGLDVEVPEYR